MINTQCAAMLNSHLLKEMKAASIYLRMSLDADSMGFFGVSAYFFAASEEERAHLNTLIKFLNDYDQPFVVPGVESMPSAYTEDIRGMFVTALELEKDVANSFNMIAACATDNRDYQMLRFLQPFFEEQTTSEIELRNILYRYDMSINNLPLFDEYVGELNVK